MKTYDRIYVDGAWVEPSRMAQKEMVDPATEEVFANVTNGSDEADVDRAARAARRAFNTFSKTSIAERIELIDAIIAAYENRLSEFAEVVAREIGGPVSNKAQ